MSNSRATSSACPRCALAITTPRAPSQFLKPGICVVRAKPAPIIPMPTMSFILRDFSPGVSAGINLRARQGLGHAAERPNLEATNDAAQRLTLLKHSGTQLVFAGLFRLYCPNQPDRKSVV